MLAKTLIFQGNLVKKNAEDNTMATTLNHSNNYLIAIRSKLLLKVGTSLWSNFGKLHVITMFNNVNNCDLRFT